MKTDLFSSRDYSSPQVSLQVWRSECGTAWQTSHVKLELTSTERMNKIVKSTYPRNNGFYTRSWVNFDM